MGKKKKRIKELEQELAREPFNPRGYGSQENDRSSPVSDVLKSQYGPSMCGNAYNYKGINTCGPSMKVDLKEIPEVDESDFAFKADVKLKSMPRLQKQTASIVEREAPPTPTFTPFKKKFGEGIKRKVSNTYYKAATKLDEIEGTPGGAGTKKMLVETALSAAQSGLVFGVSAIQGRKATKQATKQAFRNRFSSTSSGSGYVGTQKSQSYGDSEKKYSRGIFG